jgi:predicted transcriptional regulator
MGVHLTNRELDVMAVLWEQGSATVSEVLKVLDDELAYTTVLSVLRGLDLKGHVRHESEGKAHRFFPAIDPADAAERSVTRVLDKLYMGSRELLISRLVAEEQLSREELERIRALIDEQLGEVES